VFRVSVELGGDILTAAGAYVDGGRRRRPGPDTPARTAPEPAQPGPPAQPDRPAAPLALLPQLELPELPLVGDVGQDVVTPLLDYLLKP
jgi:hypothetical protein